MCRMAAYLGGPAVSLGSLMLEPEHSLKAQAHFPRKIPEHGLPYEPVPVDRQVQHPPGSHIGERQAVGVAIDDSGDGVYGVDGYELRVLGALDPGGLFGGQPGQDVYLAVGGLDELERARGVRSWRCSHVAANGSKLVIAISV